MPTTIRPATPADAGELGRILFTAFQVLADHHNFPRDFPSVEAGVGAMRMLTAHPGVYGIVAEVEGRLAGSNFVDLRSPVAGIGPISVDPEIQNRGVGRALMGAVMEEARARDTAGIRLVQAAYHNRSLCLYTRLGFATREPLSVMQGPPLGLRFAGYEVRPAGPADVAACNELCRRVHGIERAGEVEDAIAAGTATVVEHLGRITGYATDVAFFAHAVGDTDRDLQALIGAAPGFAGPGFLLPTRNHEVFVWCLAPGNADDADDDRPLQRAARRLAALDPVLIAGPGARRTRPAMTRLGKPLRPPAPSAAARLAWLTVRCQSPRLCGRGFPSR